MADDDKKAQAKKAQRRKKPPVPENRADINRAKLGVMNPFSPDWPVYNPPKVQRG